MSATNHASFLKTGRRIAESMFESFDAHVGVCAPSHSLR